LLHLADQGGEDQVLGLLLLLLECAGEREQGVSVENHLYVNLLKAGEGLLHQLV